MNKGSFSQIAKKLIRADQGLKDPQLMHPAREWSIGIVVGVIMFLLSAGWSAQIYVGHRDTSATEVAEVKEETVTYRASLVEAALAGFDDRQVMHNKFLNQVEVSKVREVDILESEGEYFETEDNSPQATSSEQFDEESIVASSTEEVTSE